MIRGYDAALVIDRISISPRGEAQHPWRLVHQNKSMIVIHQSSSRIIGCIDCNCNPHRHANNLGGEATHPREERLRLVLGDVDGCTTALLELEAALLTWRCGMGSWSWR